MLNANITIAGIEDTGTIVKIKDSEGKTWTFFKNKKSGGPTVAFDQFSQYKVGDTTGVAYNENPNPKGGVFRNIVSFQPPVHVQARPAPVQTSISTTGPKLEPQKETDWYEIAVGKCQTAFLAAFIQAGHTFSEAKLQATQARQLAHLVVYGNTQPATASDDADLPPLSSYSEDEAAL